MTQPKNKIANQLLNESSPYLLQHAYNPVQWLPFTGLAFEKAKRENKPLLISIGYSACHWCHVMEHESFEDEKVAELMNNSFINVKVDREERNDVDMLYMQAVQLMTGHGGWPLNCFVLPDGRPFYGGTYFNKSQWLNILENISKLYQNDSEKVNDYADRLTKGIQQAELLISTKQTDGKFNKSTIQNGVEKWKNNFDTKEGGVNRAPKFPLPSNYQFLLRFCLLENDEVLRKQVELTLKKMAFGGIYDQLRGGFSRYSTDLLWKVPHFEKMLYDNSQLVSLYCEAYLSTKNELYKNIAIETLNFVEEEWYGRDGNFYSAYDADSDGEEGKYYVWTEADLKNLLGEDYQLFSKYYEVNEKGYWEHGNYILMRSDRLLELLAEGNLTRIQVDEKISNCKVKLLQEAKSRIKPALDDKTITAWNAMMCSAFAKAYLTFGDEKYKRIALESINFILSSLSLPENKLYRTYKNGIAKIDGFLDDYAFTVESLINCYYISQDEKYLSRAFNMTSKSLEIFNNPESDFLFYTDNNATDLVTKTTEVSDNVIPSSNSQMAINLFTLGTLFDKDEWKIRSQKMLDKVDEDFRNYGSGYSNWACLALLMNYPRKELVIVGKNVNEILLSLYQHGITNAILALSKNSSELPLIKNRFMEGETMIYVCESNTCKIPVNTVEQALQLLE